MTKLENLFLSAAEECSEIQYAISKRLRFGSKDYCEETSVEYDNDIDILVEFYELSALIEELIRQEALPLFGSDMISRLKDSKIKKVLRYQEKSKALGLITG